MPQITFSRAILTGATDFPLSELGWQYEYAPYPAAVRVMTRTTAVGVLQAIYSGSETIQEESNVQSGGTAGITPSPLNTTPLDFMVAGGDRLKIALRNTTGGTLTVDGIVQIEPL